MLGAAPSWSRRLTALGLIAAPFVLPHLGFAPNTVNQILVWGLFGIGFDILFGYTGLLSFGQSAFFGTGGFVAAYLLTNGLIAQRAAGAAHRHGRRRGRSAIWSASIALRRTGIYFAMITVAIAEMFFFIEFSPLSALDRRRERPARRADAELQPRFGCTIRSAPAGRCTASSRSATSSASSLRCASCARRSAPSSAPSATTRCAPRAVGHQSARYKLTAFVIAAAYAGFAGGLLGVLQGFMPPDAFTFDTSGQLVMQTAIGGVGTLFGPLVGATVWLFLRDFLQGALGLGATWKLVLGVVFVLLVCFLRRGLIGGLDDLYALVTAPPRPPPPEEAPRLGARRRRCATRRPVAPPPRGAVLAARCSRRAA